MLIETNALPVSQITTNDHLPPSRPVSWITRLNSEAI